MLQGCVRLSVVCNVLYVLDTGGQPSLEDSLWRGCGRRVYTIRSRTVKRMF